MAQLRWHWFVIGILIGLLIMVPAANPVTADGTALTPARPLRATPPATEMCCGDRRNNPFGILIGLTSPERADVVASLGVAYFRPNQALVVDKWDGTCPECDLALQKGLKLILTVKASGGAQDPSSPPKDIAAYQKTLTDILDKYPPEVLVVENEENSTIYFTGTPQEYAVELQAACQVAHGKGIKCANGGLVSDDVALVVWDSYFESGGSAQACDWAKRTLTSNQATQVCRIKKLDQLPARDKEKLDKDKTLLQVYKASSADYMNFHWYIPDLQALREAAGYLQKTVGLPLISNEMGQKDDNPVTVVNLLTESLKLRLSYVIWFSGTSGKADKTSNPTPLINPDNTLRPTGEAFKTFLHGHFR